MGSTICLTGRGGVGATLKLKAGQVHFPLKFLIRDALSCCGGCTSVSESALWVQHGSLCRFGRAANLTEYSIRGGGLRAVIMVR